MSIENITANILDDARKVSENSISNAENIREDIINNAKKEAQAIIKSEAEKAAKDAEDLKSRKVSAAQLQGKKNLLQAKQESIKKSFNAAIGRLKEMPENEYLSFLLAEILKIPNVEGSIVLNSNDRENIGERLAKAVNEKLQGEKVVLSNDTHKASGGFVLKKGKVEINSTFESLLDSMKDHLTSEIANALFK